mmetsp:Transcript_42976/g.104044  ORF Transcript_42976/g.104044 Transcript_42976/m.104044 type:complete len:364 (+) Transcript_42976:149-1240(+)
MMIQRCGIEEISNCGGTISERVPSNSRKEDNYDALIAGALNQLSINERENVYNEMHGVDDLIEESPEMVQRSIVELHAELERVKGTHRVGLAYNMAEAMSGDYVHDHVLRMKFLRSERFDVKKSAERLVRFFNAKMQLFGQEKLCKDITLQDLDKDDIEFLKSGHMQILPTRDSAGRVVVMVLLLQGLKEIRARVFFYLMMMVIEDEETQKRGLTSIGYSVGRFDIKTFDLRSLKVPILLYDSLPTKTCVIHLCFNDPGFRYFINFFVQLFSDDARARHKFHCGTHIECLYLLMAFGFPVGFVPLTAEGEIKTKVHWDFLKMRQRQESMVGVPRIVVPTLTDVLFGRGMQSRLCDLPCRVDCC